MDNSLTSVSQRLAKNIESLRRLRNLSQVQLAQLAGLPRTTLTHMESGSANPSLQNLLKIASALQVSTEELLSSPREEVAYFSAQDIPQQIRKSGVMISKLLPDAIPGMEIDRIDLEPLGRMKGTPHTSKTKEYFYCLQGRVEIYLNKKVYEVKKGDLLAFPGDVAHAYVNPSSQNKASGFSVVALNYS